MQFGTTFWVIFSAVSLNVTAVNRCVFETMEEGLMWYRLCEAVFVFFFLFFRFLSYGLMTLVSCKKKQRISYASCSLWHYFNTCFFFSIHIGRSHSNTLKFLHGLKLIITTPFKLLFFLLHTINQSVNLREWTYIKMFPLHCICWKKKCNVDSPYIH